MSVAVSDIGKASLPSDRFSSVQWLDEEFLRKLDISLKPPDKNYFQTELDAVCQHLGNKIFRKSAGPDEIHLAG